MVLDFGGLLNIFIVVFEEELIHLFLIHQVVVIVLVGSSSLLCIVAVDMLDHVQIYPFLTAFLDVASHQVIQLICLLRMLLHRGAHLSYINLFDFTGRLSFLVQVDAHEFNGTNRRRVGPRFMVQVLLVAAICRTCAYRAHRENLDIFSGLFAYLLPSSLHL